MMMTKTNSNNNNDNDDDYCNSNISFWTELCVKKDTHEDEWFTSLLRRNWYNHVAHGIDRLSLYITANRQNLILKSKGFESLKKTPTFGRHFVSGLFNYTYVLHLCRTFDPAAAAPEGGIPRYCSYCSVSWSWIPPVHHHVPETRLVLPL